MAREDTFTNTGLNREDEHFRKWDLELIKRMRTSAEREAERQHMAEVIGVVDDTVLDQLQELGLTCQTVKLLYLLPPLSVAWIDGSVTRGERECLLELARSLGIEEGTSSYEQLSDWLQHRPSHEFSRKALGAIQSILEAMPFEEQQTNKQLLTSRCKQVAGASGGVLGLGSKVSYAEWEVMKEIARELASTNQVSAERGVQ